MDQVSKAALIDLVADLLRACDGEEPDDAKLVDVFIERFGPVARIRGDKLPKR